MHRSIEVQSIGKEAFSNAIKLLFTNEFGGDVTETTITHFKVIDGWLCLFKSSPYRIEDAHEQLYPLKINEAIEWAWGWLERTEPDHPRYDTDGSVEKCFEITTGFRDYLKDHSLTFNFSFVGAIRPTWMVYGK